MRMLPRHFELHIPTKTILKVLLWLLVASAVIQDHSALARAAETGRVTAIDAVLKGEEQPVSRRAEGHT